MHEEEKNEKEKTWYSAIQLLAISSSNFMNE